MKRDPNRLYASYRVETPLALADAAAQLAGEQSSGTFVAVPGESEELKARFAARVEGIIELDIASSPSLPGGRPGDRFQRGEVTVSWSVENFGANLPTIVSTVEGNLYELRGFTGMKLLDLEFPDSLIAAYAGPKHGVEGTRRLTGAQDRPMIGTIIKPSVGLSPTETAALIKPLVAAGIDFIKDDELMANPPHSPFDERVEAVMRVVNEHAGRTGKHVMVAFNVTDDLDAMLRHYDKIVAMGGTCAMVSINSVGLSAVKRLCEHGELSIHGHRNGWGMLNRHPMLGVEFPAYQKFWRLAGIDQLHVNGIANKFWESDDSVVRSIQSCLAPLGSTRGLLPVVSSGQWGGQAFETYRRTQTIDLLYMAGGGVMAHPGGPAAGVAALQQAWSEAVAGKTLAEAAATHAEFRQAVEKFGDAEARRQIAGGHA
ncbi:ribulose-bisphosphate carboxylase large subunit family protein [Botrimarina mediterranea]|uniref:Ribulose bisphosphate carboxylase-like protein 2 n=1 Tax=Botrimarina mediterranea TaxID=2528022 RepID=A0A518K9G7_9BACT|nr:ribulose-bisphosphate carboxylase large subunit family protein [Botrimarina mediterranea]QDV74431.1 Ribulose bisphosphate carboxylase-like protein 2 [Botrimarina mediterranea]QDV79027.1 Ribulose bisphosphate carboxylase-like protein 2 [Planctomycetes bacterium K2D]